MNENIRVNESTVFNPQTGEFAALPEVLQFTADKSILKDETPVVINWAVSNATLVKLNNEPVESTGSKEFHSTNLLSISLVASNEVGEIDPRTIIIDIDRIPPTIHSFKIDKPFAIKGSPISLLWHVEGARTIEIDNGVGDVTNLNSKVTTLGSNGIFKIVAKNYFGIISEAQASVSIFPIPVIEGIFIPSPQLNIQGITYNQPTFNLQVDFSNNLEINPFSLNLNLGDFEITRPQFNELDKFCKQNLFSRDTVNALLFPNNIFRILSSKQKEITYIVKSIWKREIRKELWRTGR